MEHQLVEASKDLKQSLATNSELSTKIAQEGAERELAQQDNEPAFGGGEGRSVESSD